MVGDRVPVGAAIPGCGVSRRVTMRIVCDGCGRATTVEGGCTPTFDSGALVVDLIAKEPARWGVLVSTSGRVADVCPRCWRADAPQLVGVEVGVQQ